MKVLAESLLSLIVFSGILFFNFVSAHGQNVCAPKNFFKQYADVSKKTCDDIRSRPICRDLEKRIIAAGEKPESKLRQCTTNGAASEIAMTYVPFVDAVACGHGVVDFAINTIVGLGTFIGTTAGAIHVDAVESKERTKKCNSSLQNKTDLYRLYNISTPALMNIPIPDNKKIEKMQCWQIENELRATARYRQRDLERDLTPKFVKNFKSMSPDEIDYWRWAHPEYADGSGNTELLKTAKAIIEKQLLELSCYSAYTAQALVCEALALAATTIMGGVSKVSRLQKSGKILEIAGVQKRLRVTTPTESLANAHKKTMLFLESSNIKHEEIIIDGHKMLKIIPDKNGHWLARQAEVYQRKYQTDYILADESFFNSAGQAQYMTTSSQAGNSNYIILSKNLDFYDVRTVMGLLNHEMTHARVQSAAYINSPSTSHPPIYLESTSGKIPMKGYESFLTTDEVEGYAAAAKTYRSSMLQAYQQADPDEFIKFESLYKTSAGAARSKQAYLNGILQNAESAVQKHDRYTLPKKEFGIIRTIVNVGDGKNSFPMTFEFPANTPTDPAKFKQILLERIQKELTKNKKLIDGL